MAKYVAQIDFPLAGHVRADGKVVVRADEESFELSPAATRYLRDVARLQPGHWDAEEVASLFLTVREAGRLYSRSNERYYGLSKRDIKRLVSLLGYLADTHQPIYVRIFRERGWWDLF